jgi:hypothetical protein
MDSAMDVFIGDGAFAGRSRDAASVRLGRYSGDVLETEMTAAVRFATILPPTDA